MSSATPEFKQLVRSAFGAMHIGESYTFRRTFTDGDVALFCGVSGDYNPYHLDDAFAAESWYGRRTIPGLLTVSMVTHIGGMLGFLATDMDFTFLAAVYVGDTITCTFTITGRDEERRRLKGTAVYTNGDGQDVLRAEISGFPSQIRLRPDAVENTIE